VLRHQPLQPHQAGVPAQVRANLTLFEWRQVNAVNPPRQQLGQVGLAHRQRQLADIFAVAHHHVEGVELDLTSVLAAVQAVEVGAAVDAQRHRFAVDHERTIAVAQRRLHDQRIALRPVVTVAGEQPHMQGSNVVIGMGKDSRRRLAGGNLGLRRLEGKYGDAHHDR